jgi:putative oxidoreductase
MARLPFTQPSVESEPRSPARPAPVWFGDGGQLVLRVGAGLLFLQHGLQKLFGLLGGNPVPLASLMGVAGVMELVGGVLLVLGLWTRPTAFLLACEMAAAFIIAHLPRGGWPVQNGGELPLLYVCVFLFLALAGPGPASLDATLRRRVYAVRAAAAR